MALESPQVAGQKAEGRPFPVRWRKARRVLRGLAVLGYRTAHLAVRLSFLLP
jgi:hypothetical protein